jgi:hypothetical protein
LSIDLVADRQLPDAAARVIDAGDDSTRHRAKETARSHLHAPLLVAPLGFSEGNTQQLTA